MKRRRCLLLFLHKWRMYTTETSPLAVNICRGCLRCSVHQFYWSDAWHAMRLDNFGNSILPTRAERLKIESSP